MCRSPEGFHGPGNRIRFDTEGMLRRVHFGEGKYQEMDKDERNHGGDILPRDYYMDEVTVLFAS